ncbi:MAG TPA: hypothetical protein PLL20_19510 [Phycisphaerae bacterium]|nr:hypothetical protein [Phycisphaerae bacterium]HRR85177.1 hypothetical protein [Phycisphaerae bacterium]
MTEDYVSAAARHLRDADTLLVAKAWDNAAYLAGYIGECGVKAVIQHAGLSLRRIHLNEVKPEHLLLAADLSFAARRYPIDLDREAAELWRRWSVALRYARTGEVDEPACRTLLDRAKLVFRKTVVQMVLDGVLQTVPK